MELGLGVDGRFRSKKGDILTPISFERCLASIDLPIVTNFVPTDACEKVYASFEYR